MSNSWKQYGGVNRTEKLHNVGVGTLIADQILLRTNITLTTIQGTLEVTGNINGKTDINIDNNLYVSGSTYLNQKLYFQYEYLINLMNKKLNQNL